MFVCVDALCLFLPGIGRICWLKKGTKIPLNTEALQHIFRFQPFFLMKLKLEIWEGLVVACVCLCERVYTDAHFCASR